MRPGEIYMPGSGYMARAEVKLVLPIGRVNPEQSQIRGKRTKSGKPRIRYVPEMANRSFTKVNEAGIELAYTPLEQNLDPNERVLFRLRRYRSETAALVPRNA